MHFGFSGESGRGLAKSKYYRRLHEKGISSGSITGDGDHNHMGCDTDNDEDEDDDDEDEDDDDNDEDDDDEYDSYASRWRCLVQKLTGEN